MTDEIKKTNKAKFMLGFLGWFTIISSTLSIVLWLFPPIAYDMDFAIRGLLKSRTLNFDVQQVALLSTMVFVVLIFLCIKKIKRNAILISLIIISLLLVRISFQLKQYLTYEQSRGNNEYQTNPYLRYLRNFDSTDNKALYSIEEDVDEIKDSIENLGSIREDVNDIYWKLK